MGQISIYNNLKERKAKLALIGLGYVGLPIAIAFSKKGFEVVGFDLNNEKVELYKNGVDPTFEVGDNEIKKNKNNYFTWSIISFFDIFWISQKITENKKGKY